MPYLFKERDILDQLSLAPFPVLSEGLVGADVGLIPALREVRLAPGSVQVPAFAVQAPNLPACTGTAISRRSSMGFGLTAGQLFGSACGEFVERYSANVIPRRFEAYPAAEQISVREFQQFTDAQYASPGFPFTHPDAAGDIRFHRAMRASDGRLGAVPADLAFLHPTGSRQWCAITSNGLAAGRNFGMAARGAVFELIERDAFMRAWYRAETGQCFRIPERVPMHFTGPLRRICRQLELLGITVTLVRFEGAGGVPVILACARSAKVGLAVGCAAKSEVRSAMTAAFLESVHTYNWSLRMLGGTPEIDAVAELEDHIAFHAAPENRKHNAFLDRGPESAEADFTANGNQPLGDVIARTRDQGWDVWLADLRSPDVARSGWHVVRALSPQAATLDVEFPHLRQHGEIRNPTPHPFP
jgi:ribosomal protein S12 methylthiotransferase accessory factor